MVTAAELSVGEAVAGTSSPTDVSATPISFLSQALAANIPTTRTHQIATFFICALKEWKIGLYISDHSNSGQEFSRLSGSPTTPCLLIGLAVSTYRYQQRRNDTGLREQLTALAREKPRHGYRRLHVLLLRSGTRANHKRVWRVYQEAGLSVDGGNENVW